MEEIEATATEEIEAAATNETVAGAPETERKASADPEPPSLDLVIDLPVQITVEIGRTRLLLREVLELGSGSVLELDRGSEDPADVLVNGRLIARGDLTVLDDRLAVRIVELVAPTAGSAEDS